MSPVITRSASFTTVHAYGELQLDRKGMFIIFNLAKLVAGGIRNSNLKQLIHV